MDGAVLEVGPGNPKRKLGDEAERAVAAYFEAQGYVIEATNHLCKYGEVDVIARHDELYCFVEVRMRGTALFGAPAATVGYGKQRRVAVAALDYLQRKRLYGRVEVRFDVVSVVGRGDAAVIAHIPGAFDSPF